MSPVRFVMACCLPFKVELIDILCIFSLNQFSDKLELLSKAKDCFLENGNLFWRPFFKRKHRGHWIDKDIKVTLFVNVDDAV